jgi:hypothetical protein
MLFHFCADAFKNEKRTRAFLNELNNYSNEVKSRLQTDSTLDEREKYHFLRVMGQYEKKYNNVLRNRAPNFKEDFTYLQLKDLYESRREFGTCLSPVEISQKLQNTLTRLPILERRTREYKRVTEMILTAPAVRYQHDFYHFMMYASTLDKRNQALRQIKLIQKIAPFTEGLIQYEQKQPSLLDMMGKFLRFEPEKSKNSRAI